jgi:hypothetical protein
VTRLAYKSLDGDGHAPFTRTKWPLPKNGEPTGWIEVLGKPELCQWGLHGWKTFEEARKHGTGVYEMEIEGETVEDDEKIAGTRARLLRIVGGYYLEMRTSFGGGGVGDSRTR